MKKRRVFIIISSGIVVLILILLCITSQWFYKLTHSHSQYFAMYSSCGVADAEAVEFEMLNDRYGTPGNPCITYGENTVGIWVFYPMVTSSNLLQLTLKKDLLSSDISFNAKYCTKGYRDLPDKGNPAIVMELPLLILDEIVHTGVPLEIQTKFEDAARDNAWSPVSTSMYDRLPVVRLTME